jgi:hypothetical protein
MKSTMLEMEIDVTVGDTGIGVLAELEYFSGSPASLRGRREDCEPPSPSYCTVLCVTPLDPYRGTEEELLAATQKEADNLLEVIKCRSQTMESV